VSELGVKPELCIGRLSEQDMALAANRMLELGGGIVIVEAGT